MSTPIFDEALAAASEPVAERVRELLDSGAVTYVPPMDTESEGAYLAGAA